VPAGPLVRRSPVRIRSDSEVVALHGNGRPGFLVDLGPLRSWGLELQARRIAVATDMAEATMPNPASIHAESSRCPEQARCQPWCIVVMDGLSGGRRVRV
jgi:hypothetical protein